MNRTQALAKLKKVVGPKLAYRENAAALVAGDREAAKAALAALNARVRDAESELHARRKAVLDADSEFQRLKADYEACITNRDKARSRAFDRRIVVGTSSNGAGMSWFHVKAEGDNWQEVVDALAKKQEAA